MGCLYSIIKNSNQEYNITMDNKIIRSTKRYRDAIKDACFLKNKYPDKHIAIMVNDKQIMTM